MSQKEFDKELVDFLSESVAEVMNQMRPLLVQRIRHAVSRVSTGSSPLAEEEDGGWTEISSLSQLRSEVGGRFQNIKKKWIDAGFPLKEHKGDSGGDYELLEEGWLVLSNWVSKQGYEIRKSRKDDVYFEIRK